jgi:hypothetical protein
MWRPSRPCRSTIAKLELQQQQHASELQEAAAREAALVRDIDRYAAILDKVKSETQKALAAVARDSEQMRTRAELAERNLESSRLRHSEETNLMASALHALGKDMIRAHFFAHMRAAAQPQPLPLAAHDSSPASTSMPRMGTGSGGAASLLGFLR